MFDFRKIALAATAALPLAGCGDGINNQIGKSTYYTVDSKTGLCFSVYGNVSDMNYSHTWVPCTKEVVALLPVDKRVLAREIVMTRPALQP